MKTIDRSNNNRNATLCKAAWLFCTLTALSSYIPTSFAADVALESSSISQPTAASSNNNRVLSDSTDFNIEFSTFSLEPRHSSLKGDKKKEASVFDEQQQQLSSRVLKGDEQSSQEPATNNDEQQKQQLVLKRQQKKQKQLALKRQRAIQKQKRLQRLGNPPGINRVYSNGVKRGNAPGINKRKNNNGFRNSNSNSNKNRWQNGGKPSGQPPKESNNNNWSSGKLCPCPTWQGTTTNKKWGGGRKLDHQSSWWGGNAPPNAWNNGWTNGWGRTTASNNNKWWGSTTKNNNWNNRSSNSWGVKWCACPTPKPTPRPTCEFYNFVCSVIMMLEASSSIIHHSVSPHVLFYSSSFSLSSCRLSNIFTNSIAINFSNLQSNSST